MVEEEEVSRKSIQDLVNLAYSCQVTSNVDFDEEQVAALENLSQYCVQVALDTPEVKKKPLKVIYKANEAMHKALVAMCLAQALVNPRRKNRENKHFFINNITIYQQEGNVKFIDFGQAEAHNIQDAIYWEIVEDWKLYYDKDCGGIRALVDEKTNLTGLDNYTRGGDPMYEFARFHRKYKEKVHHQENQSRVAAEDAFRNAVMQSVATEVAKQQLLEGKSPMDIIDSLLNGGDSLRLSKPRKNNNQGSQKRLPYKPD